MLKVQVKYSGKNRTYMLYICLFILEGEGGEREWSPIAIWKENCWIWMTSPSDKGN
jgi:hypothetical protein